MPSDQPGEATGELYDARARPKPEGLVLSREEAEALRRFRRGAATATSTQAETYYGFIRRLDTFLSDTEGGE